jgi:hypothetical protein
MLEHLKTERQSAGGAPDRLRIYMIGLVIIGGFVLWLATQPADPGPTELPDAQPDPEVVAAEAPSVDLERLPATDEPGLHARWQWDSLEYVFSLVDRDFAAQARRLPLPELDALPYEEARGGVFETEGTVEDIEQEQHGEHGQILWSVLIGTDDGSRLLVLKPALRSDNWKGHPRYAYPQPVELVQKGDTVLVRGIYVQRRVGTFGEAILRKPAPVLVTTPPPAAFRKLPKPAAPIGDPAEADWDEIEDRFLGETKFWAEDALFEVIQWARSYGYERLLDDMKTGKLKAELWDAAVFERWGKEVRDPDPRAPRPVTESFRGRFFKTRGVVGAFLREGWKMIPRKGSRWGVDTLYKLDLISDHWGNRAIRTVLPWPAETYGDAAAKDNHVTVYGYFLKNFTYKTQQGERGEFRELTMPMFIVLHVETVPHLASPYRDLIWAISGIILVLFIVFYLVFVRGEKREAARMDTYRRELRKRRRERTATKPASDADEAAPGVDEGEDDAAP